MPPLGFHEGDWHPPRLGTLAAVRMRNYLRVPLEEAAAGARCMDMLDGHGVPIEQGLQTRDALVVLTAEVAEARMAEAARALARVPGVRPQPVRLRVEAMG